MDLYYRKLDQKKILVSSVVVEFLIVLLSDQPFFSVYPVKDAQEIIMA